MLGIFPQLWFLSHKPNLFYNCWIGKINIPVSQIRIRKGIIYLFRPQWDKGYHFKLLTKKLKCPKSSLDHIIPQ